MKNKPTRKTQSSNSAQAASALLIGLLFCLPGNALAMNFYGETDKDPLSYNKGEQIVFTIDLLDFGKPVGGKKLQWERQGDDGLTEKGEAISGEEPLIIKTKSDQPGFVRVTVKAFEPDGSEIKILPFQGSAGVDWRSLQGLAEPEDFDAFWAKQKANLAGVPIRAEMVPVLVPEDMASEYFDIKIDCPGNAPVSGYFRRPKNAAAKSLPARIAFIGYNHNPAILPKWANDLLAVDPNMPIDWAENPAGLKNGLVLNINAHGYENGRPKEYYDKLRETTLKAYGFNKQENENPETSYWLGMLLRAMRALEWMKQQPEWDGKTLVVAGGSQGGFQALAAAGLDPSVSECHAFIPWMCNVGMERQGRVPATFLPEYTDGMRYFDASNHAKRIKGNVHIVSGLGDYVCPPTAQAVLYNNINSPKNILFVQGKQHPQDMPGGKSYSFSEKPQPPKQ
jgi:cephalosporin-C deacetylase